MASNQRILIENLCVFVRGLDARADTGTIILLAVRWSGQTNSQRVVYLANKSKRNKRESGAQRTRDHFVRHSWPVNWIVSCCCCCCCATTCKTSFQPTTTKERQQRDNYSANRLRFNSVTFDQVRAHTHTHQVGQYLKIILVYYCDSFSRFLRKDISILENVAIIEIMARQACISRTNS